MQPFQVVRIEQLNISDLEPLRQEGRTQGFKFVDGLAEEYQSGRNRFALPGEALFGIYGNDVLCAVGGLNHDVYLQDPYVGRVRHVYVLASQRRQGLGRILMQSIIEAAQPHFRLLTLRTMTEPAARFYQALGFQTEPAIPEATHHLQLGAETYYPPAVRGEQGAG